MIEIKKTDYNPEFFRSDRAAPDARYTIESTVTLVEQRHLEEIKSGLDAVWHRVVGANSMEGYPRYNMTVTYQRGETESFIFSRSEWGASGIQRTRIVSSSLA